MTVGRSTEQENREKLAEIAHSLYKMSVELVVISRDLQQIMEGHVAK